MFAIRLMPIRFSILSAALFLWVAGSASADAPVRPETLLKGFIHPPVNFSPGEEYGSEARKYQGIPTIERAPGGRLWAAWYAGPIREDQYNYMMAATSGDDGKTWSDLKLVVDPDGTGPLRASDPCLWLDPNGRLWLFWWMNGKFEGNGLTVTMAISTENPDAENPVWTEPKALFPGVMLNKPIVARSGEWLMPAAIWHQKNSCRMMVSKDDGKTWALRGTANVPEARRQCDEPMVVQRKDGSLWQLVRTAKYGIGETVSTDGGRTWTEVADYLHDATSRFHLRKLRSGNLLLIKHGPLDQRIGRKELTAYLSTDDGATWKGGLLIDERKTVSYPDATQAPDGTIYAIYDWNREDEKNILMTTFTERDVLAGAYVSDQARSRILVNRATGINPKPWLKKSDSAAGLRTDTAAAPFDPGRGATLAVEEGVFQPLEIGATLFSNRAYTLHSLPDRLAGMQFLRSPMEKSIATCLKPGRVYVLTPAPNRNHDSVEGELLAQGFEKTSVPEFFLFTTGGRVRFGNACSIYQKQVREGEKIAFGKWGLLVWPATTPKPPPVVVRVACIGDSITFGVGIENREKNCYPAQLAALLGKRYEVMNFGVSGATLLKKGDRPHWQTEQFAAAHDFAPDIVVIMLGTNDSKPGNRIHFSDFVSDYVELIGSFQSLEKSPRIWICQPVPAYRRGGEITDEVIAGQVMPMIDEVARRTGVGIIDLHAALSQHKEMFPKGIHPNAAGAELMAKTVFSAISMSTGRPAQLSLASIFSDHMVLQREKPVPVWGRAMPGATVTVEFAGQTKSGVAGDRGRWQVTLDPMPASSKSRTLQVSGSQFQVSITDVLVGEVWLCSGQSNMEMALQGFGNCPIDNSAAEIAAADCPEMRLYHTPRTLSASPRETVDAQWAVCAPETARTFSACAYFFGRKLQRDLNVPVGLLLSAWGGTRIEPWTPPCGFKSVKSLNGIYRQVLHMPALNGDPRQDRQFPTALYNGMLAPHIPFAIRGAIWYQGEANHTDGMLYVDKTRALLNGWRERWGTDFPFYFVQIGPCRYGNEDPGILPQFWEAQAAIVKTIPNTGMAVITDVSSPNNLHPSDKKTPGDRLARLAEANTYGMNVVSTGPVFQALETSGGQMKVTFTSAEGLTTRDGKEPDWFEIAGADGVFKPAHAEIEGDGIILESPDVPEPLLMRFAWSKLATPNLMNGAGLPASAFRAGNGVKRAVVDIPDQGNETGMSSKFAIDFEKETKILQAQEYPETGILRSPGGKYDEGNEKYDGVPGIGISPKGRIWVCMGRSKDFEDIYPYCAIKTSGDNGVSWSKTKLILDPDGDGPESVSEGTFWLDPLNRLWFMFNYRGRTDGGNGKRNVVMAMHSGNPDSEDATWSRPQPMALGWMINKPIVTSDGRWLMPSYFHMRWNNEPELRISESTDQGKSWHIISCATIPKERRQHDEPVLLEKNNGELELFVRTAGYGIGRFVSRDGGRSWSDFEDYMLHATSRFQLRRLQSGNLIFLRHGPLDKRINRSHLTAYLSRDDGKTWEGGLMLDERSTVSYPDVDEYKGTIYVVYDWNRTRDKNILMATFNESDVLQKKFASDVARSRILVDKQTGYNPENWLKEGRYIGLKSDKSAAAFQEGERPSVAEANGDIRILRKWVYLFSDRPFFVQNLAPELEGKQFVHSPFAGTRVSFSSAGMVYVFTPTAQRNQDVSQERQLLKMGFEKTGLKEFVPFLLPKNVPGDTYETKEIGAVRAAQTTEACSVFQKQVQPGETLELGSWGVLCF